MTHDTTPPPLRADARRNRQRLLDVADAAFRADGVSASMEDIARRAGVGVGTLYRHFPTREALILVLVADDLERLASLAEELLREERPDAVGDWLRELIAHNLTYRGLAESIRAASDPATPLGAACHRLHGAGAALVRHGQEAGEIRDDVEPVDPIALAEAISWAVESDPDRHRLDRLVEILLDGLRPPVLQ